jgi:hypothetical protein
MLKRTLILITQEIMIIKMMIRSQKIKITMAEIVIILIQLYA